MQITLPKWLGSGPSGRIWRANGHERNTQRSYQVDLRWIRGLRWARRVTRTFSSIRQRQNSGAQAVRARVGKWRHHDQRWYCGCPKKYRLMNWLGRICRSTVSSAVWCSYHQTISIRSQWFPQRSIIEWRKKMSGRRSGGCCYISASRLGGRWVCRDLRSLVLWWWPWSVFHWRLFRCDHVLLGKRQWAFVGVLIRDGVRSGRKSCISMSANFQSYSALSYAALAKAWAVSLPVRPLSCLCCKSSFPSLFHLISERRKRSSISKRCCQASWIPGWRRRPCITLEKIQSLMLCPLSKCSVLICLRRSLRDGNSWIQKPHDHAFLEDLCSHLSAMIPPLDMSWAALRCVTISYLLLNEGRSAAARHGPKLCAKWWLSAGSTSPHKKHLFPSSVVSKSPFSMHMYLISCSFSCFFQSSLFL